MLSSSWPRIFFSGSLNFAVFFNESSDFFQIAAKVAVFGFVVVDVFDVVIYDDDDDIFDVFDGLFLPLA